VTLSSLTICLQGLEFNVVSVSVPVMFLPLPISETVLETIILLLVLTVVAKAEPG
jgi:hypothetical protein